MSVIVTVILHGDIRCIHGPLKMLSDAAQFGRCGRRAAYDYRRPKTPSNTRPKVVGTTRFEKAEYREPDTSPKAPKSKRSKKSNWTDGKLPILRPSEKRYRFLKNCTRKGVFLVDPESHGRPLVVIVAELPNVTVDEAERRPNKVRRAIEKRLDKHIRKPAEESPPAPLSRGPARKSIHSGRHPSQKVLGVGRREKASIAKIIEGASP
jgi:hypothetical protein